MARGIRYERWRRGYPYNENYEHESSQTKQSLGRRRADRRRKRKARRRFSR